MRRRPPNRIEVGERLGPNQRPQPTSAVGQHLATLPGDRKTEPRRSIIFHLTGFRGSPLCRPPQPLGDQLPLVDTARRTTRWTIPSRVRTSLVLRMRAK